MHLDDETIERLRDGELHGAAADTARAHAETCAACAARLEAAAREAGEAATLLARLDHPLPARTAADVIRRAPRRRVGWAAAALLVLGGAAAAHALPGSPLRGWIDVVAERLGLRATASAPAPAPAAGIAVEPGAALVVDFIGDAGGSVEVEPTDSALVAVSAPAGTAEFAHEEGRISVRWQGDARFLVRIPRDAARVEIHAHGRPVLVKSRDELTVSGRPAALPLRLRLDPARR